MHTSNSLPKTAKQAFRRYIACLLLAAAVLTVSACGSAAENITSEADMIEYLTKTFGQKEYNICDTVEHEKYKVAAFTDDGGKLGYVFLRKAQGQRGYDVFTSDLQQARNSYFPNGVVWKLLPWEKQLLLLLVTDEKARTAVIYKNNEELKRFPLDKGKNAAYILSVPNVGDDLEDADTYFSVCFEDEKGKKLGNE